MNCSACDNPLKPDYVTLLGPHVLNRTHLGEVMMKCETCKSITTEHSRSVLAERLRRDREEQEAERARLQQEAAERAARNQKKGKRK